jgi:hypothetical protein
LDRGRGSVEKEQQAQGLFSFLPKIEVLSRTSLEVLQDILVLTRGMWNLATGVQLNGCAALWVCS